MKVGAGDGKNVGIDVGNDVGTGVGLDVGAGQSRVASALQDQPLSETHHPVDLGQFKVPQVEVPPENQSAPPLRVVSICQLLFPTEKNKK